MDREIHVYQDRFDYLKVFEWLWMECSRGNENPFFFAMGISGIGRDMISMELYKCHVAWCSKYLRKILNEKMETG